jgi:hypothetical protein
LYNIPHYNIEKAEEPNTLHKFQRTGMASTDDVLGGSLMTVDCKNEGRCSVSINAVIIF